VILVKDKISIIISCYNEEETIEPFYKEISKVMNDMNKVSFELIFIDDGSIDNSLKLMKSLHKKDDRVRYISFSRNFGKEAAMYAGLKASTGDYVAVMDVDLQDPPKLISEMYKILKSEDYDQVATRRVTRDGEPIIRSIFARKFYKIINKISDIEMVDGARDFRLMKRKVVSSILSLKEYNRYSKGIFSFVGFKTKWLEYENIERVAGETKWSFWALCKYAIEGIVAFSTIPLESPLYLGAITELISLIMFIICIVKHFEVSLFMSLATLIIFMFGLSFICIGIVGLYLSKDYFENKKRPIYIIQEVSDEEK